MSLFRLLLCLSLLFIVSCESTLNTKSPAQQNISKSLKSDDELPVKKVVSVEPVHFIALLENQTDAAMRAEGLREMAKLVAENKNSDMIPLKSLVFLFNSLMSSFPFKQHDLLMLQLSTAYEKSNQYDSASNVLEQLLLKYPESPYTDEVLFRRAEILFNQQKFYEAELLYRMVIDFEQLEEKSVYYERAVYKQGRSQFEQGHYQYALNSFMHLLDLHTVDGGFDMHEMKVEERAFIDEVMRETSLCFANQGGPISIKKYFKNKQKRSYEEFIFISLADYYRKKNQLSNEARTYRLFVSLNKLHIKSPSFLLKVIDIYERGGFKSLLLDARKDYVQRYDVNHVYWGLYSRRKTIVEFRALKDNLRQLIEHYQYLAVQSPDKVNLSQVEHWYRIWLYSFPDDTQAWKMNFNYAEILEQSDLYERSAIQYEKTAYGYERHSQSSTAAYNALLMYAKREEELSRFEKKQWHKQFVDSAGRFNKQFPEHSLTSNVLPANMNELSSLGEFDAVLMFMDSRNWMQAAIRLEKIRSESDQYVIQAQATKMLARVYLESTDLKMASIEFEKISFLQGKMENQSSAYWLAAELAAMVNKKRAIKIFENFIKRFPQSLQKTIEASQRIVELAESEDNELLVTQWKVLLVNADAMGAKQRTQRTRYLAAKARFSLAEPLLDSYRYVPLSLPLDNSIKVKYKRLDMVIEAYRQAAAYQVEEVSAAAIYRIAMLYQNFSQAILYSQTPQNMNKNDLKKYSDLLNEKSRPFRKKAIKFHEKNISGSSPGLKNMWVKKSLVQLKRLLPERYNKAEYRESFIIEKVN